MTFQVRPAVRTGIKPLVGFYGRSGSGKTMSALLFARGLAGPKGKIVMVDSENKRGSIFADLIPGGYDVIDLDAPFSPGRYEEAIVEAEKTADVVLVDSMSHEWSGEGGVLDLAEAELKKMGGGDNNKMRSWIKPKMAHKMMVQRLLRTKCALICCLRGEEKTHMIKDGTKTKVVTDEFSSPIFDPRFIFEMLLNFETVAKNGVGGFVVPRKITHPGIASLLPQENEQVGIRHGEALAKWCQAAGHPDPLKELKRELWKATESIHQNKKENAQALELWLINENLITDTQTLDTLTAAELPDIIKATREKIILQTK